MAVELRELTKRNWEECIRLRVRKEQEAFVAPNLYSIAESRFFPTFTPLAIYSDGTMVGFTMYGLDPNDGCYWIQRLMIDERYQGKGYGRAAMQEILRRLGELPDCREVRISHEPENAVAARLYGSLGFRPTGEMLLGEVVYNLALHP